MHRLFLFVWLTSESSHGGCESWSPTSCEFMWWTFFAQLLRKKGEFWPKVKMSMGVGAGQKCHSPLRSYKPDHQAFVTRAARPSSSAHKENEVRFTLSTGMIVPLFNVENAIFVTNETLKLWYLWQMRLWNCDFCDKWDFEIVNFVTNETLKLWILWKMRLWNCEFCKIWDSEKANFDKKWDFESWIFG